MTPHSDIGDRGESVTVYFGSAEPPVGTIGILAIALALGAALILAQRRATRRLQS